MKVDKSEHGNIVNMYNSGLSQREIAKHYNVSGTTIGAILKQNGIICKNRRYKLNIEHDTSNIVQLSRDGYSILEIANLFGVTSSRIGQILRDNSINTPNSRYLQLSKEEVFKMHELYLSGVSRSDIAEQYDICTDSVYNLFLKYGFDIQSMSHAKQKYAINEEYFDVIDTPNKAYMVGLLYADGCNMTDKREITLTLQECDRHILEQIKDEIGYSGPLKFIDYNSKNSNHKNQYKLDITNKHMSESLNKLGVWKNKSLILEWPEWLDEKLYSHFIRGYFDGDGCLYLGNSSNHAEVSFVGTIMFLTGLREVIKTQIGVDIYINSYNKRYQPVTKEAKIHKRLDIKNFLEWIYKDADLMLYRKYDKYQQFLNNINNSCCA